MKSISKIQVFFLQSHPHAIGLRNKPFPFFDDLVQIFGKERATRATVEIETIAMEDIDVEDDTFEYVFDVEQEAVKYFESREDIGALACQAPTIAIVTIVKKVLTSKKRPRSINGLFDLVEEIGKIGVAYREVAQEINDISIFQKKRQRKVNNE